MPLDPPKDGKIYATRGGSLRRVEKRHNSRQETRQWSEDALLQFLANDLADEGYFPTWEGGTPREDAVPQTPATKRGPITAGESPAYRTKKRRWWQWK